MADVPGSSTAALSWPDADGRWPFAGTSQTALRFQRDQHGAVVHIDLTQVGKTYGFQPLAKTGLPSVDEIEALRAKLRKIDVRSLRMHCAVAVSKQKGEATVICSKSPDDSLRFSSHTQLGTLDQTVIVDGQHTFVCTPKKPREDLSGARAESMHLANPLERLGDWRHDGTQVEVVDKLESQGRDCWVVRLKPHLLPTMLRWVDVENGRVLFEHGWQIAQGLPTTAQTLEFSDWRDTGGVDLPAHIERQSLFGGKLTIDYDALETNVEIAPSVFACPETAHD